MPLEQDPEDRPTRTQVRRMPRVHWGHLQQSFARHGVVTSRLVIYPPSSSERERRWAHRLHLFAPIALGGGTASWLLAIALGASPESAGFLIACILAPVGTSLWARSRRIRSRAVTIWSNRVGLWPDREEAHREKMIDALSERMELAASKLRRGTITLSAFERIWISSYTEAAFSTRGSARVSWSRH